jgi:hypothetical protein
MTDGYGEQPSPARLRPRNQKILLSVVPQRAQFEEQIVGIDEPQPEIAPKKQRKREQLAHRHRLEEAQTRIYASKKPPKRSSRP